METQAQHEELTVTEALQRSPTLVKGLRDMISSSVDETLELSNVPPILGSSYVLENVQANAMGTIDSIQKMQLEYVLPQNLKERRSAATIVRLISTNEQNEEFLTEMKREFPQNLQLICGYWKNGPRESENYLFNNSRVLYELNKKKEGYDSNLYIGSEIPWYLNKSTFGANWLSLAKEDLFPLSDRKKSFLSRLFDR